MPSSVAAVPPRIAAVCALWRRLGAALALMEKVGLGYEVLAAIGWHDFEDLGAQVDATLGGVGTRQGQIGNAQ